MVKPYRSAAAAKQVVAGVRVKLSQGLLKPGQRLPNERELAAELAVNMYACLDIRV
jgi:DNA-binding FadR family transcriptional regulator